MIEHMSFAATRQRESKTRFTLPAVSLYVSHLLVSAIASKVV